MSEPEAMSDASFLKAVNAICEKDHRYHGEAYFFLREALSYTGKLLKKPAEGAKRHVKGQELLEGIRAYALEEYGPVAITMFRTWGIEKTEDFGEIVFNLVESGELGKTPEDRREDFAGGYDFHQAFVVPFLPSSKVQKGAARRRTPRRKTRRPGGGVAS